MKNVPEAIARYRANRQDEVNSAALYRAMADAETQQQLAEVYRRLAEVEDKHADFWAQKIQAAGYPTDAPHVDRRTRLMLWLVKRFGPQIALPRMAATERANQGVYDDQPEARGTTLPADERSHARVLAVMVQSGSAGMEGSALARLEGRHRAIGGNALRAAVLGSADGLVSNLSLVMGVAGARLSEHTVLVTGLAGLLAGACSMAIGEWVSVQSSRELNQRQLAIEASELAEAPEEEAQELTLIYQAKGIPEAQAQEMARRLISDPDKALDTLAREELGIDPKDLGGSAWEAAITSFLLFALGAIIPVIPFFFLQGSTAVGASLAISTFGLFGIGAAITLVTGRSVIYSGFRQLLFGLTAATLTYAIGRLIGITLAG